METIIFTDQEVKIIFNLINEICNHDYEYAYEEGIVELNDSITNVAILNDSQIKLLKDIVNEAHCYSESSTEQSDLSDIMDKLLGR